MNDFNYDDNDDVIEESLSGLIGKTVRKISQDNTINKSWNRTGITKLKTIDKLVDEETFDNLRYEIKKMKEAERFGNYKPHFNKFCNILDINTKGCVIFKYKFTKTKKNENRVFVQYHNAEVRHIIPSGSVLYHISTCDSIKELKPTFKGKDGKGYLYSSPRVYLTLRKNMPKFCADLKNKTKVTKYIVDEQPKYVYIDPFLPLYSVGAVYIETNLPIKVKKLTKENGGMKRIDESYMNIDFSSLDDEVALESVLGAIGNKLRDVAGKNEVKRLWDNLSNSFTHKWTKIYVDEKKFKELKKAHEVTKLDNPLFNKYKTAFNTLCKAFSLSPNDVVIERVEFPGLDKTTGKYKCALRYSQGQKKIVIPNGYLLTHMSPNDSIKELKPTFKSKKSGRWLYPCRRVYFTISKDIDGNKFGVSDKDVKMHKYRPKENIRVAYIDQTYTDYGTGAVYVNTSFPIPVDKIE